MNKKTKIILCTIAFAICLAAGLFVYRVNKAHHYTPVTSEIIINDEDSFNKPFLLGIDENTLQIQLKDKLSFISDVENNTANLETRQVVFWFYECDINRVYEEYIPNITYTSSNEDVASVDENGVITAVSKGEAIITVTADDVVLEIPIIINKVVLVTEFEQNITMLTGEEKSIVSLGEYEVVLSDFLSSNESVVTINENGIVVAKSKGIVEVYTYTDTEQTQKVSTQITVKQPVESVSVNSISIYTGQSAKANVSYSPTTANYGTNLTYKISDTSIASVSGNTVTGIKEGKTTLTVTSGNGIVTQSQITVTTPPRANATVTGISKAEFDAHTGEKFSDSSPYATHFKITLDQDVIGFKINYVTDNIDSISTGAAIYNNASVPANTTIYFEISVNESDVLRTRGFSYVNADGSVSSYTLYQKGSDGSIGFTKY